MKCDNCAKRENCRTRIEFIKRMPFANIASCTRFKEAKPIPPMTNGDRIRSMSDEELAGFLDGISAFDFIEKAFSKEFCNNCPPLTAEIPKRGVKTTRFKICDIEHCPHGSPAHWWLKQPVEGFNDTD